MDYGIIESEKINLKKCLKIKHYTSAEISTLNSGTIVDWAKESRSYLNEIYSTDGATLSAAYIEKNTLLIEQQIQKAGIRLAGILKTVFEEEK